jgi:hypothetical protein
VGSESCGNREKHTQNTENLFHSATGSA